MMGINEYFKNRNMRNLAPEEREERIYRIIPFFRLEQMLQQGKNTLVKILSWDDPYENFFYKQEFDLHGTPVSAVELGKQIFGQCWSSFKDSDALWRIYSQDKQSVRIRTTIGKLYDSAYLDDSCMVSTFIGKISYQSKTALNNWLKSAVPISTSALDDMAVDSLFLKRNNFTHEREVRLIYRTDSKSPELNQPIKQYDINVDDFIEEITFDPRCDDSYYKAFKDYLIKTYKIDSHKINKSSMYVFKPNKLQLQ
jgi:hypothetical protein